MEKSIASGLLLSVIVENITTRKDNTLKIVLGSQEMSQARAGELFGYMNKLSACYLSLKETIGSRELAQIDKLDPDLPQGKTQSQRIRNVLFLLFEKDHEGFSDFDSFYKAKTEMYINHLKAKIDG